ncbi:hypothetical protein Mapa_002058 [Marchantia paleacea]|nr:hypothetical protein Mapa_002058 [Marchantia paleacea]
MIMNMQTMEIRVAVSLLAVLSTLVLTRLWLRFGHPWLQCLARERILSQQGVPVVPGRTFVQGHAHLERKLKEEFDAKPQNLEEPHNIVARFNPFQTFCTKKYGKTFVYWRGREVTLHTQDPEVVREVFVAQTKNFCKTALQKKQLEALVGKAGIVTAEGSTWAHQRKIVAPAFHVEMLKKLVDPMLTSVNITMEKWEKLVDEGEGTAEIDVSADVSMMTGDIICRTSFRTTYEKGQQYFYTLMEIVTYTMKQYFNVIIPGFNWIPTAGNRRMWKLRRTIKQLIEEIVLETRRNKASAESRGDPSYGEDLLGLLMEGSDAEEAKYRLNNEELIDQVKTFFFAGTDTSAVLLRWALMLLATHLDWQEKAYAEVQSCCGGAPLTFDSLSKLRVVGMILNEALRLYPPAIWMQREATKDLQLSKIFIPKGLIIYFNVLAMHHDPDLWGPDASAFRPERFADGAAKAAKHPQAFVPFSVGPRNCVGQTYALLEAKIIVATIMQKFKFRISPNYIHQPVDDLSPKPKHGVPILFSRR